MIWRSCTALGGRRSAKPPVDRIGSTPVNHRVGVFSRSNLREAPVAQLLRSCSLTLPAETSDRRPPVRAKVMRGAQFVVDDR